MNEPIELELSQQRDMLGNVAAHDAADDAKMGGEAGRGQVLFLPRCGSSLPCSRAASLVVPSRTAHTGACGCAPLQVGYGRGRRRLSLRARVLASREECGNRKRWSVCAQAHQCRHIAHTGTHSHLQTAGWYHDQVDEKESQLADLVRARTAILWERLGCACAGDGLHATHRLPKPSNHV